MKTNKQQRLLNNLNNWMNQFEHELFNDIFYNKELNNEKKIRAFLRKKFVHYGFMDSNLKTRTALIRLRPVISNYYSFTNTTVNSIENRVKHETKTTLRKRVLARKIRLGLVA